MDEVLVTAVNTLGEAARYVELSKLRDDAKVRSYFRRVLFKQPWTDETFAMFFQSRSREWDFDEKTRGVKVRSELDKQIAEAMHKKRKTAPLPEALYTAVLKAGSTQETANVISNAHAPEVAALPIDGVEALLGSLGEAPKVLDPLSVSIHVNAQVKVIAAVPGALEKKGSALGQVMEFYKLVLQFGGEHVDARVQQQKIETLKELCEVAGGQIREKGLGTVTPKVISLLVQTAPFHILPLVVSALGDKGDGEDVKACASLLAKVPVPILEGLSRDILLQLAVAATKSSAVAEATLGLVAKACAGTVAAWDMDEVSKLLLALSKAKPGTDEAAVADLYARAAEAVAPMLQTMSDTQLIKVVLALGRVVACKEFLDTAAAEGVNRIAKIPSPQLLLLTQGFLPLGADHPALAKILDFWATSESKAQLTADQLAKLAQLVAPVAPASADFWKALGEHLMSKQATLTDAGKASLLVAFPEGGGPSFPEKEKLMAVLKPKEKETTRRSRSRDDKRRDERREGRKDPERDGDRERDTKKKSRSRSRGGGRDRQRNRSRSRERRRR